MTEQGKKTLFVDLKGTLTDFSRPLFEALPRLLKQVKEQGIQIIVITGDRVPDAKALLTKAGFDLKTFDEIHSTSEINETAMGEFLERLGTMPDIKSVGALPKATLIDRVMRQKKIPRDKAIMVGDSPEIDLTAARIVGIQHSSAEKPLQGSGKRKERKNWTNKIGFKKFLGRKLR